MYLTECTCGNVSYIIESCNILTVDHNSVTLTGGLIALF